MSQTSLKIALVGWRYITAIDTPRAPHSCEINCNCSGFVTFGSVLVLATCCATPRPNYRWLHERFLTRHPCHTQQLIVNNHFRPIYPLLPNDHMIVGDNAALIFYGFIHASVIARTHFTWVFRRESIEPLMIKRTERMNDECIPISSARFGCIRMTVGSNRLTLLGVSQAIPAVWTDLNLEHYFFCAGVVVRRGGEQSLAV